MKAVIITLALAGLASTAPVDAQILGTRLPTPATNANIGINGSWQVVGRDGNGNTIYERRTQDRNGNIIVQRARRDSYGNMSIISTNTIGNNSNRGNNCAYNQSTNSVGNIIFGRTNTNVNCNDVGNRVDGGWYQVGQGRNNNSIYERRVRDANGNLVIQRARRNSNGTFTIISTRGYNDNSDRQWQRAQDQQNETRKQRNQQDRRYKNSRGDNGDNSDNRSVIGDDNGNYVANDVVAKGNGHVRGNGNGRGKHKGND
jgi:hypothetical protein